MLRAPVVYVPVVFVEELVVLVELGEGEVGEVFVGKGGQEEVGFEDPALAGLVEQARADGGGVFVVTGEGGDGEGGVQVRGYFGVGVVGFWGGVLVLLFVGLGGLWAGAGVDGGEEVGRGVVGADRGDGGVGVQG